MAAGAPGPGTFLSSLTEAGRAELTTVGVRCHWHAGDVLFREGDEPDRVLVLQRGATKLVASSEVGVESVLGLRSTGEVVGEFSAIDGEPRSATAVAITPVTALALGGEEFRRFLTEQPGAAMALLTGLVGRLRDADRRRVEFGAYETTPRLAHLLAELAIGRRATAAGSVEIRRLSQEDLAGMCGASREAVSRSLGELRAAGLITTGRRSVTVHDTAGLRRWGT